MSEERSSVEQLLERIDELLVVLKMVSRDLADISQELKGVGAPKGAPTPPERVRTVEDVKVLFPKELEEMLTFEESAEYIVVKPRQFLGSENFAKIASTIRDAGGEYISAGKESHFRVAREM